MAKKRSPGPAGHIARRLWLASLIAACLAATDASASNPASPAQSRAAHHAAAQFEPLAGSAHNARALVEGLRWGIPISLTASHPARRVEFTPPTRPMGYGNVVKALTVAKQELAARGIVRPSPDELRVILIGGSFAAGRGAAKRFVRTPGILPLRSVHMGWGRIAHELAISPTYRPALATIAPSAAL